MRACILCLPLLLTACLPKAITNPAEAQQEAYAQAMGAPTHAPATDAQWQQLGASARAIASSAGATTLGEPVRLKNQGYAVEHRFEVKGGHCYAGALAWDFPKESTASVHFQPRADGKPVNDGVGGAAGRFQPSTGLLKFCADRDGEALLTVSAIGANGAIAMNELLEYAFVLGARPESAEEAAARRKVDAQAGEDAKARQDANVAAAKERERRNLEERCSRCREDFRLCQVEAAARRRNPPKGVTHSTSCESQFYVCATGKYSGTQEEMRQCGEPPK
ncbi:MAG: hypothetical protein ACK4N5_16450 [Myxococcales bacterium]